MADWKQVPKIDAHVHILPDAVIAANQGVDDPFVLAGGVDAYVRLMDEYHITKAVIMPFNDPFLMSMEFTAAAVHENLIAFQKRCGDRFLLFADVDVRMPVEETLAELRRVMATGAFAGIKLHPTNTDMPLDGEYFDAVFAFAEEHGIPVEVHSYPKDRAPQDLCAPARLRTVLARHPALRVSVAHLGGFQYADLAGMDVWVNISAILPDLWKRLGKDGTNRVLRQFSTDRLIFATDYPASRCLSREEIYSRYFAIMNEMDFTEREIRKICQDNILHFLGMSEG